MERDRFKVLVEQLMCKKTVPMKTSPGANNIAYRLTPTNTISGGEMLAKTQDHNNMLKLEVIIFLHIFDQWVFKNCFCKLDVYSSKYNE